MTFVDIATILGPDERRAPVNTMTRVQRETLLACLSKGELMKRRGWWRSLDDSFSAPGVTVANLIRDGLLRKSGLRKDMKVQLNAMGNWYARTLNTKAG